MRERAARPRLILFVALCGGMAPGAARADRVVLGPTAETLAPISGRVQFLLGAKPEQANRLWLDYSSPAGIEMELERVDLRTESKKRYAFNIEYPLLPDFGTAPAVAVGVRDLAGTGTEHGGLYAVVTHSFALPDRIYRVMRLLKGSAGLGTGRIGGPFAGIEARFGADVGLHAEVYRHRPNIGLTLRLTRHLQAEAASLDGSVYYGLSYSITH